MVDIGWGEWGSCLRPPFFWGPPSKTAYTVLDSLQMFAQRTIRSEDLFFFFWRTPWVWEKNREIGDEIKVKTVFFFFFREHFDFGRKISKPRSDLFFFSDNINFWKFLPRALKLKYPPLVHLEFNSRYSFFLTASSWTAQLAYFLLIKTRQKLSLKTRINSDDHKIGAKMLYIARRLLQLVLKHHNLKQCDVWYQKLFVPDLKKNFLIFYRNIIKRASRKNRKIIITYRFQPTSKQNLYFQILNKNFTILLKCNLSYQLTNILTTIGLFFNLSLS